MFNNNYPCIKIHLSQYDNHQLYCPDYEEDIQTIVANQTYGVESVLRTLYERNEFDWSQNDKYPELFNSSRHIQYRSGSEPLCQHYMSIFTAMIKEIYWLMHDKHLNNAHCILRLIAAALVSFYFCICYTFHLYIIYKWFATMSIYII